MSRAPLERDRDAEAREEIRFHLDERERELIAGGMPPEEAARAARRAFGDPERVAREVGAIDRGRRRGEGRRMIFETAVRETRQAARGLVRRPALPVVVVATLGLALGAVTTVFGVAEAALLRALPFPDGERIVFLQGAYAAPEGPQVRGASPAEARDWESMSRSFTEMAAFAAATYTLTGAGGDAERVAGETVDEGYLEILGAAPIVGRAFAADELAPGGGRAVALVGEDLWTRRWGRDPSLVGRAVLLDGTPFTVVGILPRSFPGASLSTQLWVPFASVLSQAAMQDRGDRWAGVVARLRAGVDVEWAQRDMEGVAARLEALYPEENRDRVALVRPARDVYLGSTRALVLVVLGATGLILLIAAANVVNLLLVRARGRASEALVRRALGAGRGTLARQAVVESLLLAGAGTAAGILLGAWGAPALARAMPATLLPAWVEVRPDAATFALAAGLMAVVGVLAGLLPVLAGDRDVAAGLGSSGAGRGGSGRARLQGALVAGEVALAIVLLVGAGLMVRSLRAQLAVDPGFDAERLLTFTVMLPGERYPDEASRRAAAAALLPRLAAEPGVSAVTLGADAPLRGGSTATYLWTGAGGGTEDRIRFYYHRVQPGWFETMRVPVVQGRPLQASDGAEGLTAAVISRSMAERHFGGVDPVGRTLFLGRADGDPVTIVGVAGDVRWRDLTTDLVAGPDDPDVYVAWPALPGYRLEVALRTTVDPAAVGEAVRRAVRTFDPGLVPYDVQPMTDVLRTQTAQGRFGSLLLTAFSVLAAALAAVGLYGVLSFAVGRRTREIAVRMAVGADGARVRRMVVGEGLRLAAGGVVLGLACAWVASRALRAFLFGVAATDPATYLGVALLMVGVAALASWIPARRATRVDPNAALSGP